MMNIAAVLLAGGKSRRMGEDKATLIFRGKPLWQMQLDLLRRLEPAEILISAQRDPIWRPLDVQFVPDNPPLCGPLSGLAASLTRIGCSHLMALAIDMPFMTETFLQSLCHEIEPGRGVLPMIGKRAEPLAAIYPRESQPDMLAALLGTDFSLQTLTNELVRANRLRIICVAKEEEAFFQNLNQPSDLPHFIPER